MIGWRVGWIAGPADIMKDIGLVSLTNVVCQVGIGMPGAAAALTAEDDGIAGAVAELQARRDVILNELSDLPVVRPDGGWSLLIDTVALGMSPADASQRLFETGQGCRNADDRLGQRGPCRPLPALRLRQRAVRTPRRPARARPRRVVALRQERLSDFPAHTHNGLAPASPCDILRPRILPPAPQSPRRARR